jgi:hypothetical protein
LPPDACWERISQCVVYRRISELQDRVLEMERRMHHMASPGPPGFPSPQPSPLSRTSVLPPFATPPEPQGAFAYAHAISMSLLSPDRDWTQLAETIRTLRQQLAEESTARYQAELQVSAGKAQMSALLAGRVLLRNSCFAPYRDVLFVFAQKRRVWLSRRSRSSACSQTHCIVNAKCSLRR